MEQSRIINELQQKLSKLEDKVARGGIAFGLGTFTSQAEIDKAKQEQIKEEAAKKAQIANDFGVPQELLDFLKQKITVKEAEYKNVEQQLGEARRQVSALTEQLQSFETVSQQ